MVSGFVTSPKLHSRMRSGEASMIRMDLKSVGFFLSFSRMMKTCVPPEQKRFAPLIRPLQLDVQTQALKFLHEHIERLGNSRLGRILTFDDRLVELCACPAVV